MIFFGTIKDGILKLQDNEAFKRFIASIGDCSRFILDAKKFKEKRSDNFNRYYFGYVLTEIIKNSGDDVDYLHGELKKKFLPPQFKVVLGEETEVERRSRNLATPEFSEFVEKVKILGTEMFNIIWLSKEDYDSLK